MDTQPTTPTGATQASYAEAVLLPDAPDVPGLSFRHFRGDEDYPGILSVNNGSKIADGLEHDLHTLDTIRQVYGSTHNHDPRKDVLIAEVKGEMVAYVRTYCERELTGQRVYWHISFVLPRWRETGTGRALVRWAEGRAREIEAGGTGDGEAFVSTFVDGKATAQEKLLAGEGYQPVRYSYYMETPDLDHIPDVPVPPGLEIRPATPERYRAIWDASSEAFRDHWGATETTEADYTTFTTHPFFQPDLWVVAWDGDQVAGSIFNFINHEYNALKGRKLGYTETISVRRPWRRLGLARAMLAFSMQLHKEQGMAQTGLGVDTENPSGALRLYESMGYRVVARSTTYRKPLFGGG
ncbi:MAG TPA: GNAT family N-acetyltransferase [Chloroflexia bacterium]|nr:GNAT family N-acetyltransferase [Chloroflexia bacterium]